VEITESRQGAVTVVKPAGPICQGDAEQFRVVVLEVLTRSLGRLVVDASAIAYVDSPGLESLLAATDELASGGRLLRVAGAGETLREVIELTDLSDRFEFFDDVQTAVRSFLV